MHADLDLSLIHAEVTRMLAPGLRGLRFPMQLEARFESDRGPQRSVRMWREGLISIVAFNVFYLVEWLTTQQISRRELLVQMGAITPICMVVNVMMLFEPKRQLREGSVAAMAMVIALVYLVLQHGKGPVEVAFTLVGVIVTAMFAAVVMRLRFAFAGVTCATIVTGGYLFLAVDQVLTGEEKLTGAALMTIAIGIAMMSNFSLEREERVGYLRFLESEVQRELVAAKNAQLAELSVMDKLTGLPNRRAYEDQFEAMWLRGLREQSPLSLIVVDVDHFKALNDVYGHLYGDEVLRRVGNLLQQALRSTEDFSARYGGEEFVVLLPKTDRESGERVAERVRSLIEMAGGPPQAPVPRSECLLWVTASCGVSTVVPTGAMTRESLMATADRALYRAKAEGRNRVVFREFEVTAGERLRQKEERLPIEGHVA